MKVREQRPHLREPKQRVDGEATIQKYLLCFFHKWCLGDWASIGQKKKKDEGKRIEGL